MLLVASLVSFVYFGVVALGELVGPFDDDFCARPRFVSADETAKVRIESSYRAWPPSVHCRYVHPDGHVQTIVGPDYPRVAAISLVAVAPAVIAVSAIRRRRS